MPDKFARDLAPGNKKIAVNFNYHEHNVIPFRCRKPRTITLHGIVEVEIPEVPGEQAPVAFVVPSWDNDVPADMVRWWNETLWEPYKPWSHQTDDSLPGSKHFPAEQRVDYLPYDLDGLDAATTHVKTVFSRYLIIDGVVWCETGEPRYVIHTLGLGHNHSSTCVGTVSHYNPNIHRSRYFRADQFEQAKVEAIRLALGRGDTNSVPIIEQERPIQVLIPEAVRSNPAQEAGEGDPFLNKLDQLTAQANSAPEAGLTVLAMGIMAVASTERELT